MLQSTVYTPEEVAGMLKLTKGTIYGLIKSGDILAKKIGKTYRIPAQSLSFMFTGLDNDLLVSQKIDEQHLEKTQQALSDARKSL